MRRIIALALTVLFSLQTTASAAVPGEMHGPNVQPLLSAIENTFVFALITGQVSRYEDMRAPAPQRLMIDRGYAHPDMIRLRPAQGALRYGQLVRTPAMSSRVLLPKDAPHDPLAVQRPAQQATATSPLRASNKTNGAGALLASAATCATQCRNTHTCGTLTIQCSTVIRVGTSLAHRP